jgi:small subunit ribosomal protein S20
LTEDPLRKNKSAMKKAAQAEKRRIRNSHVKTTMKTRIKKVMSALDAKETENLQAVHKDAISYIAKAASKGVIHKNNAARRISRLSKKVHVAETKQPT